jgi:hypothetical protein
MQDIIYTDLKERCFMDVGMSVPEGSEVLPTALRCVCNETP